MTRDEYEYYKKELIREQTNELVSVQLVKDAEINLKNAKAKLAEAKEELAGIRGAISIFVSEIQRYEKSTGVNQ